MNGGVNFFVEDAFGEIYNGTFFAEDFKNLSSNSSNSAVGSEEAAMRSATSQVRMSTQSEALRESGKAFMTACEFEKNFSGSFSPNFAGKIFSNF